MITQLERLNDLSLLDFPGLFASLEHPARGSLLGLYRGSFVGPGWLRWLAGPLLVVTGLGGWRGKDFDDQGNAINLVWRNGRYERRFPMHLVEQDSFIDKKPGLALRYDGHNPFPWPLIVDELRSLGPGLVLGMTMVAVGPFKRLALPFVLETWESMNGL
jgi:hypothetical protein